MTGNEEPDSTGAVPPGGDGPPPKRGRGRPRIDGNLVARQVYLTDAEWAVCLAQGNASAFLRRLVREFAERQRGEEATGTKAASDK